MPSVTRSTSFAAHAPSSKRATVRKKFLGLRHADLTRRAIMTASGAVGYRSPEKRGGAHCKGKRKGDPEAAFLEALVPAA